VLSSASRPGPRRAAFATLALLAVGAAMAGGGATAAELPVAGPVPPVTTPEEVAVQIVLTGSDADGESLTFAHIDGPAHGDLGTIGAPECDAGPPSSCEATVTYTPDDDYSGPDVFTYRVADGADGADGAEVHITVTPKSDPPVAGDDSIGANEDAPVVIAHTTLLVNDTDVDAGTTLTITDVDAASAEGGTIVDNGDETLTYTSPANYSGPDSFDYTLSDGTGGTDTATVTVTVTSVNDDPVADDETVSGFEDQARNVNVLVGDTDVDGDVLTIIDITDGDHGTVEITNLGTRVRYTPSADYNGSDEFTYTIGDRNGGEATANVFISLEAVNDAPTIEVPFAPVVAEDSGPEQLGGFLDGDPGPPDEDATQDVDYVIDDVTATSLFVVQPSVNPNGSLSFAPAPNANGESVVTVHSFDTGGTENGGVDQSPTQTFTITITPVNDAPTAANDGTPTPLPIAQNAGPTPLAVIANDTILPDAGETLTIIAVTQGANGVVAMTGGTGLSYDPTGSFIGADAFTYMISDGALEATATVHVNVAPDITPPVTSIRVTGTASRTSTSVRVTVTWSAVELQSGISLYQLQQQTDGGAWTTIPLASPTATSVTRTLPVGHDYAFRVRAKDGIGNQGSFTTSRPLRL
jgi:hypothetical protein